MASIFGFRRRETPPIQLYGKLPLAKDYLRLGMAEENGLRFREWLDQAFSRREGSARLAWPSRFLLGSAFGNPMQGLAWPSSDAGRKRPFPFALVVERRKSALARDVDVSFEQAEAVWRLLAGAYVEVLRQEDGKAAVAALRGREIEVAAPSDGAVERFDLEHWLGALWPGKGTEGFFSELERLESAARALHSTPLRLPLVDNLPLRPQAQIWISTLQRLNLIERDSLPSMFLPVAGRRGEAARVAGFLTVVRGLPDPDFAAWLSDPLETGPLGPGDLTDGRPRLAQGLVPAGENLPPLGASVRGMLVRFTARSRGGAS